MHKVFGLFDLTFIDFYTVVAVLGGEPTVRVSLSSGAVQKNIASSAGYQSSPVSTSAAQAPSRASGRGIDIPAGKELRAARHHWRGMRPRRTTMDYSSSMSFADACRRWCVAAVRTGRRRQQAVLQRGLVGPLVN